MTPDSRQGRLLGPYSHPSTLLQFFVIGEGIGHTAAIPANSLAASSLAINGTICDGLIIYFGLMLVES
jgi:hypothetical protein